jgi:hypothetical protein
VSDDPLDRLPDEVRAPLADFSDVVSGLERVLRDLRALGQDGAAAALDQLIGRMARWAWPLLGDLDEDQGYDE